MEEETRCSEESGSAVDPDLTSGIQRLPRGSLFPNPKTRLGTS